MHKILLVTIGVLSFQILAYSQRQTSSPYSRFGYGEMFVPSLGNSQMGSISNGIRTNTSINFCNPANHSAVKKETFLFQIGSGYTVRNIIEDTNSVHFYNTGIDYFAFSFPVIAEKWGSSIGLLPFNSVGYSFFGSDTLANYYFMGDGGINQIVWGNGFTPFKGFSIGFNAAYLFGKTNYTSLVELKNIDDAYHTKKLTEYKTNGILWDFGFQYQYKINENNSVTIGATYRDKQTVGYNKTNFLGSYNEELINSSIKKNKKTINTSYALVSEIDTVLLATDEKLKTDIPQQISFGLGYKKTDKITCGIDAGYQNWNQIYVYKQTNPLLDKKKFIRAGIEYIPDYRSSKYLQKLPYRLGVHYSELPVAYYSENSLIQPTDLGCSIGTDFLLKQTANSLSVSVDFGLRADSENTDALHEKYCICKLQVNLKETWFFKRKID